MLPWTPRRAEYTRERTTSTVMAELDRRDDSAESVVSDVNGSNTSKTNDTVSTSNQTDSSTSAENLLAKVKQENEALRAANIKMNVCMGDIIVSEDSSSSSDGEIDMPENVVNTRNYSTDSQFTGDYFFITNVSDIV